MTHPGAPDRPDDRHPRPVGPPAHPGHAPGQPWQQSGWSGAPQGGWSGAPQPGWGGPPAQHTVVVVQSPKSPGVAAILGFLFGPLGLLYASLQSAAIMFGVALVVGLVTLGFGLFLVWPACAVYGYLEAERQNRMVLGQHPHRG